MDKFNTSQRISKPPEQISIGSQMTPFYGSLLSNSKGGIILGKHSNFTGRSIMATVCILFAVGDKLM